MWLIGLVWLASGVLAWEPLPRPPLDLMESTETPEVEEESSWYMEALRSAQRYISECKRRNDLFNSFDEDLAVSFIKMKYCVKENFLRSLDEAIEEKELALNAFITILKDNTTENTKLSNPRDDAVNEDLISSISKRFSRLIRSHTFKFSIVEQPSSSNEEDEDEGEESSRGIEREGRWRRGRGRRRRQYRKAFPMMVAGYMMMSAFLVPLGFQFMAMIGGKALLLAKMAFFMSLFSGYKRLTNDLEYHHHVAPSAGHDLLHHYHGFHHRSAEAPNIEAFMLQQHHAVPQQYYAIQRHG